ncbi:MAG: type IV pilus secretin PilQ [Pseudomonadaceae bacterium]|nr:type IV pilus secretin PilQ [Pseudomonadaceae bacterium]
MMFKNLTGWTSRVIPLCIAAAISVAATQSWAVTMENIDFSSLPGDRTEIRMEFDGTPPDPKGYTIEQPARIVLDLPGVVSSLDEKHHNLGIGNARRVSVVSTKDRTRAIVNLTQLVSYETSVQGNILYLTVGTASSGQPSNTQTMDVADDSRPAPTSMRGSTIENVDFRRGEGGEGRIVLTLSNPKAPINVSGDAGRIRVEVRNTNLPTELRRRLDVTDFATPVQIIDALQEGDNTVFTIAATGNYDYLAYQADNTMSIDVTPMTEEELDQRDDIFKYTGEKLSLNFQDIEVRSVLQLIADFTDLNLVASDTVSGRITLRLKNVPWDQALELILKTKGLDQRQVGNVLLVAPAAEIAAREKLELENQKQISELAPLRTDFIQIRYASASELFNLFNGGGAQGQTMLSERGSVIVDERTNAIILTDTADRLEEFRRVIAQLDVPVRQVLIEARIVTANANFAEQMGIAWGGGGINQNGDTSVRYGGSLETLVELGNILTDGSGDITSPGDLVVDLGVAQAGASSIGLGITRAGYLVDLELSALATDGHAEVVARPKVITADKSPAVIESGVEIPYQEATSSGATSTSFKDAVLSLEVTPQITPDDRIIMQLNVKQDTVGTVFNGVPSINTNEIQTEVLVDNGQTVVLGGIFQTDKNVSTTKTPFLGDIPYVGRLFKRTVERDDKQELLIFITPRIISDALTDR